MSLRVIRERLSSLIGQKLQNDQTKNRGQMLEILVAELLGYSINETTLIGDYPDLRNQALETKVQDSETIDLGKYSPQFEEEVSSCPGFTTSDIRYFIALTDSETNIIKGAILLPGLYLGDYGSYVSNISYKCQRSIPMIFFDKYDGQSVFNP